MSYLLDTNIVSAILKNNQIIKRKLEEVRLRGQEVFISCITYYEIKRGLLAVNATRQLAEFARLCMDYKIIFLDDIATIEKACEIHVDLKIKGTPIQDADVLIAATAIIHDLILVYNDSDMLRVQHLKLENWLSRRT